MLWGRLDLQALHEHAERLPAAWVIALVVLLPLVGFPISCLHVVVGVRFDFVTALGIVLITTVIQDAIAWGLVRVSPRRYFSRLAPWRKRLKGAGHRDAILFCSLVPGMPYAVQLYLLPMIGVPLRSLWLWGATLATARATATIMLGNMSDDLSPERIAWLVVYYTLLSGVSFYVLRRLRRSLGMD